LEVGDVDVVAVGGHCGGDRGVILCQVFDEDVGLLGDLVVVDCWWVVGVVVVYWCYG